jgi:hypothetical protein
MDLSPLSAQVDAALHTMSTVVAKLKTHVNVSATATDKDAAAVSDLLVKLKAGTDELDAALTAAAPALKS